MRKMLLVRDVAVPVWEAWRALGMMALDEAGTALLRTEVLGGQAPTLLTFRLRGVSAVGHNVVAVQLLPHTSRSTRIVVEAVFEPRFLGAGGRARRQAHRLLEEFLSGVQTGVSDGRRPRTDLAQAG